MSPLMGKVVELDKILLKCDIVKYFLGGLLNKRSLMKCKKAETLQTDCLPYAHITTK